jgi:adenine-specific DNA-methyltransferase
MTSDNKPYGLHRARDERFFLGEKIVSLRKTDRPHFTYTDFPCYVSQTFFVVKPTDVNLKYLVAVLNSSVCHFWLDKKGKKQGDALQVDKAPLLQIPIRLVDSAVPDERVLHDRLVALTDRMLDLHQRLAAKGGLPDSEREQIEREIAGTDREIDDLVYDLYGLTAAEGALVEAEIKR